jgi:hypothetical protein
MRNTRRSADTRVKIFLQPNSGCGWSADLRVPSVHFLEISLTRTIIVKHNHTAHNAITHTGWSATVAIARFVIVII